MLLSGIAVSRKARCDLPAVLHESVGISIASDYSTIPLTIHAALFSPSFLWKEVPRRGGGWPRETVLPHSGKPTPTRFARLPLPEEGARMIFKETLIQSLSFAVRDSRFFPPTYAAHFSAFLICLSYRQCPIRPFGAPSPRGGGYSYQAAKPPPSFLIRAKFSIRISGRNRPTD